MWHTSYLHKIIVERQKHRVDRVEVCVSPCDCGHKKEEHLVLVKWLHTSRKQWCEAADPLAGKVIIKYHRDAPGLQKLPDSHIFLRTEKGLPHLSPTLISLQSLCKQLVQKTCLFLEWKADTSTKGETEVCLLALQEVDQNPPSSNVSGLLYLPSNVEAQKAEGWIDRSEVRRDFLLILVKYFVSHTILSVYEEFNNY